jgi:hypothetical protein
VKLKKMMLLKINLIRLKKKFKNGWIKFKARISNNFKTLSSKLITASRKTKYLKSKPSAFKSKSNGVIAKLKF